MGRRVDPNSLASRARALGVPEATLRRRERQNGPLLPFYRNPVLIEDAKRLGLTPWQYVRHLRRQEAEADKPKPPEWIGVRIWPPLEPDHPAMGSGHASEM